mmetsp:Transcript_10519/g.16135  ORF Transcript_10519/g.16135 Transcript_10519/m.16135 type:complete len:332 (-) Transcript_10519:1529-2524(-)
MSHGGHTLTIANHQRTLVEGSNMDNEADSLQCHDAETSCILSSLFDEERISHQSRDHLLLKKIDVGYACVVWRERVAQWFDDVVHHLGESRRTVYVAMNILDRYLVVKGIKNASSRCYEAASLTALFLAIRIRGSESLEVFDLIKMSRLGVTIREILHVGKEMTRSVSFDRRLLTPSDFVQPMLELLSHEKREEVREEAFLMAELSAAEGSIVGIKPSTVAIASISEALGSDSLSLISKLTFEKSCLKELSHVQSKLRKLKRRCKNSKKPHLILDDGDDIEDSPPILSHQVFGIKRTSSDCSADSCVNLYTPTSTIRPVSPNLGTKKARIN